MHILYVYYKLYLMFTPPQVEKVLLLQSVQIVLKVLPSGLSRKSLFKVQLYIKTME